MSFGFRVKGADAVSAEIGARSSPRGGWGAWLTPAHCHPFSRRTGGALSGSKARASPPRAFPFPVRSLAIDFMNAFELTRALVDIESITGNEETVGLYLFDYLSRLASRYRGRVERMEGEPHRFNVFAQFGERPGGALSTHMDTVPPVFPSRAARQDHSGRAARPPEGVI